MLNAQSFEAFTFCQGDLISSVRRFISECRLLSDLHGVHHRASSWPFANLKSKRGEVIKVIRRIVKGCPLAIVMLGFIGSISPLWGQEKQIPATSANEKEDVVSRLTTNGNEPKPSGKQVSLQRNFAFASVPQSSPSPIDLGILKAGDGVNVKLSLFNGTQEEFRINKILTFCACVTAESSSNVIPAGGSVDLLVNFKVATRSLGNGEETVKVKESGEKELQLHFRYTVDGLCCFKQQTHTALVPLTVDRKFQFRLPIVLTAPTSIEDTEFYADGDLQSIQGQVVEKQGELHLVCSIDCPDVEDFAMAGTLYLRNRKNSLVESLTCQIYRENRVVMSPRVVRFVKSKEVHEATVILRLNQELVPSTNDQLSVGVTAEGFKGFSVEEKNLGKGICRVKISIHEREFVNKETKEVAHPSQLKWQVGWQGGIAEFSSVAKF